MIAGSYCRQQDSGLNYIIQTLVFQRCWSIFDSMCRLVCSWISFHDWQRLLWRVEWATICGKMIHLFKFSFFIFCQKSFCMFHRRCLSLTLVQNFLKKFCRKNDSLMNWNEIKDFFMSHLFWLLTWYLYSCLYIHFSICYIHKIT